MPKADSLDRLLSKIYNAKCLQSIADAIPSLSKSDRYALSEAMMAKLETAPDADIKVCCY